MRVSRALDLSLDLALVSETRPWAPTAVSETLAQTATKENNAQKKH